MKQIFIVTEGHADKVFLRQFIHEKLGVSLNDNNFILAETNAKSIDDKKFNTIITKTNSLKTPTLFILDADVPDYKTTKNELIKTFDENGIKLSEDSIFLFPDNKHDGCLEDLLMEMVNEQSQAIFACFDAYKECIRGLNERYFSPDGLKPKVFAYADVLTGKGGETKRDYSDANIWNLNAPILGRLENFLRKHFTT